MPASSDYRAQKISRREMKHELIAFSEKISFSCPEIDHLVILLESQFQFTIA